METERWTVNIGMTVRHASFHYEGVKNDLGTTMIYHQLPGGRPPAPVLKDKLIDLSTISQVTKGIQSSLFRFFHWTVYSEKIPNPWDNKLYLLLVRILCNLHDPAKYWECFCTLTFSNNHGISLFKVNNNHAMKCDY